MSDTVSGMAKRVITTLEDDLDGSEANETITFSFDKTEYEIDLNEAHAGELRAALNKYTAAARRTSGRAKLAARQPRVQTSNNDTKAIRVWALENGFPVSTRGRIQADVMERYTAAH
ncbi:histone-like nucleoid-structuring protein Lsr2 [Arthrobacter sp. UNC362MFTsu5.1]|uniref:histone-like nucleoid-structuring protein Lsr2 n=1 Tax=Arthrobacter sp. UNC362MFTsu5.1 TaxID=1449044 RepID=UPI000AD682AC|nr:Lsr2 family protein [Arthrobacter sp. UNC362MFTsu5.1]